MYKIFWINQSNSLVGISRHLPHTNQNVHYSRRQLMTLFRESVFTLHWPTSQHVTLATDAKTTNIVERNSPHVLDSLKQYAAHCWSKCRNRKLGDSCTLKRNTGRKSAVTFQGALRKLSDENYLRGRRKKLTGSVTFSYTLMNDYGP